MIHNSTLETFIYAIIWKMKIYRPFKLALRESAFFPEAYLGIGGRYRGPALLSWISKIYGFQGGFQFPANGCLAISPWIEHRI